MAAACVWPGGGDTVPPANVAQPSSEIPFETKEPDTYAADIFVSAGGAETRNSIARKDEKWRFDTWAGATRKGTQLRADKLYQIDHASKTYTEVPVTGPEPEQPQFVEEMTATLLNRKEHATYEKIGSEGTQERYRVTIEGTTTPSIVTYDTSIGMIVRQEFEGSGEGGFVFELRNFTLDVADAEFQLPAGYRKIAWNEFKKSKL